MKMLKKFPSFNFFPKTWIVPADNNDFKKEFNSKLNKTFIVKPEAGCQGRGIFLIRRPQDIPPQESFVVQKYLAKPFLIDGLKFDLRIYVLVAGVDPLRVYMYKEGMARFATEKYVGPNYSNLNSVRILIGLIMEYFCYEYVDLF
jgi:tubulin polyglutamylase TTLL6/13